MSEHITLYVRDILGCTNAVVLLREGEVTEVVGPNAAGKTSVAVAAQACLTMDANPMGLDATEARAAYIRDRTEAPDEAWARLEWEQEDTEFGESSTPCELVWRPNGQSVTAPPWMTPMSSKQAAGLIDFTAKTKARDRAENLQGPLLPDEDVVLAQLSKRLKGYLVADDIKGVTDMIREQGFDEAENNYRKRALEAKRAWEKIAGRRYGSSVAVDWRPDRWHADWDSLTPQLCAEHVVAAREALTGMHIANAVSQADADRAADAESRMPDAQAELADLQEKMAKVDDDESRLAIDKAMKLVGTMRDKVMLLVDQVVELKDTEASVKQCPHCDGPLLMTGSGVVPHDAEIHAEVLAQREAEHIKAQQQLAEAEEALEDLKPVGEKLRARRRELRSAIASAERRVGALQSDIARGGTVLTAEQKTAILEAEQAVEDAKATATAVEAMLEAKRQHESVLRYQAVIDALGPQGVRATMLEKGLGRLNKGLEAISEEAGWPAMSVSDTSSVRVAGRPVTLASESEQWRAQAAMQLTLGALDKSRVVVLDRADVLDDANRAGLVAALQRVAKSTHMAILVCSTGTADPDAVWPQSVIGAGVIERPD